MGHTFDRRSFDLIAWEEPQFSARPVPVLELLVSLEDYGIFSRFGLPAGTWSEQKAFTACQKNEAKLLHLPSQRPGASSGLAPEVKKSLRLDGPSV